MLGGRTVRPSESGSRRRTFLHRRALAFESLPYPNGQQIDYCYLPLRKLDRVCKVKGSSDLLIEQNIEHRVCYIWVERNRKLANIACPLVCIKDGV